MLLDCLPHAVRAFLFAEELEQHGGGEDGGDRVGDSLAGDVRGRAVDGLEHGRELSRRVQVGAAGEAHAADHDGGQVGEDVAEEVRGDHHVEHLGRADEVHGRGVDEHGRAGDVRVIGGDLPQNIVPEHHAVLERVRFGDARHVLPLAPARGLEGVADDALGPHAGEVVDLDGRFVRSARVMGAAEIGVLAFGVLTDDDQVDVVRPDVLERAVDARVEHGRPDVDVLIETLAHAEKRLDGDVVRRQRLVPQRPQEDGVEGPQLVQVILGRAAARRFVQPGVPADAGEIDFHRQAAEDLLGLVDDFRSYAVARIQRDLVGHTISCGGDTECTEGTEITEVGEKRGKFKPSSNRFSLFPF